jgi:hypothetical protein
MRQPLSWLDVPHVQYAELLTAQTMIEYVRKNSPMKLPLQRVGDGACKDIRLW